MRGSNYRAWKRKYFLSILSWLLGHGSCSFKRGFTRPIYAYLKVLGEYSYTLSELDLQAILQELFSLMERKFEGNIKKELASNQLNPWYDSLKFKKSGFGCSWSIHTGLHRFRFQYDLRACRRLLFLLLLGQQRFRRCLHVAYFRHLFVA